MDFRELVESGTFLALDIEGDGVGKHRPGEIAVVRVEAGRPVDTFRWLVNPGRPIDPYCVRLHGIDDAMVADAPAFAEIEDEFRALLEGAVVVGHYPRADMDMLWEVMDHPEGLPSVLIDTGRLARSVIEDLPKPGLASVGERLGLADHPVWGSGRRHSALGDAMLCAGAFLRLSEMLPARQRHREDLQRRAILPPRAWRPRPEPEASGWTP